MKALEQILHHKIVAILRGVDPAHVKRVVEALYSGGVRVLEITLNSPGALQQIRELSREYHDKMLIGAGTVLDMDGARAARDAGAAFLISPGLDIDVVKYTRQHHLVSIPGAYTPTEIMHAHKAGADIVKIFPVNDAAYIRNVSAPLDHIRMMPTGGINTTNIHEFHKAGAVAFGIGSALVGKTSVIDENYLSGITEKAKTLVTAVSEI